MSLIVDRLIADNGVDYGNMPKRDGTLVAFGQNVRKYRELKGVTQEWLAQKSTLDRTYISDIERGARNLGIKNVVRIARALGISTAQLCQGLEGEGG